MHVYGQVFSCIYRLFLSILIRYFHCPCGPWILDLTIMSLVADDGHFFHSPIPQHSIHFKATPCTHPTKRRVWMLFFGPYREDTQNSFITLQHHLLDRIRDRIQLLNAMRVLLEESIGESSKQDHVPHFLPDYIRIISHSYGSCKKQAA